MKTLLLAIMLTAAPPGRTPLETAEAGRVRYEQIAEAIETASGGNKEAAAILLSISFFESGWRVDVDDGRVRGDGGKSCTIFQLQAGNDRCDELLQDRARAARYALSEVRRSMKACAHLPTEYKLNAYASGKCDRGFEASARRMRKALEWQGRL